jgi:hypothetical protein
MTAILTLCAIGENRRSRRAETARDCDVLLFCLVPHNCYSRAQLPRAGSGLYCRRPAGDRRAVSKGHDCGLHGTFIAGADRGFVLPGPEFVDYTGIGNRRPALESASRDSVCDGGSYWSYWNTAVCNISTGAASILVFNKLTKCTPSVKPRIRSFPRRNRLAAAGSCKMPLDFADTLVRMHALGNLSAQFSAEACHEESSLSEITGAYSGDPILG